MRELFVKDLENVRGGHHRPGHDRGPGGGNGCGGITTLACGEEANGCSGC